MTLWHVTWYWASVSRVLTKSCISFRKRKCDEVDGIDEVAKKKSKKGKDKESSKLEKALKVSPGLCVLCPISCRTLGCPYSPRAGETLVCKAAFSELVLVHRDHFYLGNGAHEALDARSAARTNHVECSCLPRPWMTDTVMLQSRRGIMWHPTPAAHS